MYLVIWFLLVFLCICGAISVWPWYVVIPKYFHFFFLYGQHRHFRTIGSIPYFSAVDKEKIALSQRTPNEKKTTHNLVRWPDLSNRSFIQIWWIHTHRHTVNYTHTNETHNTHIIKHSSVMMHYNENLPRDRKNSYVWKM